MKFKLDTPLAEQEAKIEYASGIVCIGSCFSDEMAARFSQAGFDVLSNPFGTVFHPLPLARTIENALHEAEDFCLFEAEGKHLSWNASALFSGSSEKEIRDDFRRIQQNLREYLRKASHLFITFGTAWGYELLSEKYIVANCHKQPASRFEKQLFEIETVVTVWEKVLIQLAAFNPGLKVIFTVSPVRHIKDGLVENNRSKARLLETITRLEKSRSCTYFPSYEIVIDELRDYRFFKEDLVHPSAQAISYIWEKVQLAFCSAETREIIRETEKMRAFAQHRNLSGDAVFETERTARIAAFRQKYPFIRW